MPNQRLCNRVDAIIKTGGREVILETGNWKLDTGNWILETGYRKLDTGN